MDPLKNLMKGLCNVKTSEKYRPTEISMRLLQHENTNIIIVNIYVEIDENKVFLYNKIFRIVKATSKISLFKLLHIMLCHKTVTLAVTF